MSPAPWAATAGLSSTTSARAVAAIGKTARQHARTPRTLRQPMCDLKLAPGTQMARVLAREVDDEAGFVAEVAPPQPPRLLDEPERPFEPEALERPRRLALQAGVEVESRADADEHGRLEAAAHRPHELLLQRDAEADPDDV